MQYSRFRQLMPATGLVLLTAILTLGACQNETTGAALGTHATFRLANGNYVSDAAYDDYGPVVIQLSNGYLVLVFASNRTCGIYNCTAHNIFVATSVSPYSAPGVLPAFNPPQIVLDNGSASNFTSALRLAAVASGTNVNVYYQVSGALISNTNSFNPVSASAIMGNVFSAIAEYNCYNNKMLGLDAANQMLAVNTAGTLAYRFNPASSGIGCIGGNVNNPAFASNKSLALLSSVDTGINDAYFATDNSGTVTALSATSAGPKVTILSTGLADYGLQLTNASVLNAANPAGNLLVFSATPGPGKPSDLYVLTSHTPAALWRKYVAYGAQPVP